MKKILLIIAGLASLGALIAFLALPVFAQGPDDPRNEAPAPATQDAWQTMYEACQNGDWEAMAGAAEEVHGGDWYDMDEHMGVSWEDMNSHMGGDWYDADAQMGVTWDDMNNHMGSGDWYDMDENMGVTWDDMNNHMNGQNGMMGGGNGGGIMGGSGGMMGGGSGGGTFGGGMMNTMGRVIW